MEVYDGMVKLPESDLTEGVIFDEISTEVATEVAGEETAAKRTRLRSWSHSEDFNVAVLTEAGEAKSYDVSTLPERSRGYLAYVGLTMFLGRAKSDELAIAFKRLVDAEGLGEHRGGRKATAAPKRDFWREAAAKALVDATRKSHTPLSEEAATEKAATYTKEQMRGLRYDALVLRHFNKLSGATKGYSIASLMAVENETQEAA